MLNDKRLQHEFEVGNMGSIEKTVQDTLDWLEERLPEQDECEDKRGEMDDVLNRELKLKGE
eukprot:11807527-Alexandrium_andersonii.AAC.1